MLCSFLLLLLLLLSHFSHVWLCATPKKAEAMAPHSSPLAWKISWTEEPGGLQSMRSLRVRHVWATSISLFTFMHWRRKWRPTPEFLPGKSHGQRSLEGYSPWGLKNSYTTEATELMSKWIAWLLTWALRVQLAIKALPVMHCGRQCSLFKVSLLLLGLHSQGCGQISLANIQWWKWYDGTRIASLLHDKLGTALSLNSPMCFSKCFLM